MNVKLPPARVEGCDSWCNIEAVVMLVIVHLQEVTVNLPKIDLEDFKFDILKEQHLKNWLGYTNKHDFNH